MVATADDVHERLERKNVIILDVRRHDEYTGAFLQECCARFGRIPGAVWLEWDRLLDETTYKSLDAMKAELESVGATPDKEIVPYCHRGARSSNTYIALKLLGYPNVRNYVGSWHEWSHRTELPMECGEG
jgi:thiosulfate/3-mercaptopyruvate sulfurtransferase